MKKRFCSLLLSAALLLSLLSFMNSCSSKAPEVEQIYDIVVDLVERSYAANDLLFGHGLPVIAIGSELADINYLYSASAYADYEYVHEQSPYLTVIAIQDALESVYSSEFLDSYYTTLFDGFLVGDKVVHARFYEKDEWLYQSVDNHPLITWQRIYDYSTMRIIKPSNATYVTVEIDTHLENDETILPVAISITYEDGEWKLDSATY